MERVSDPFFAYAGETSAKWTCFDYDKYGRTILTTFPDKTSQRVIYNGLTVGTTFYPAPGSNLSSQTTSKTVNVAGWTVKSTDAAQIPVNYAYYADGSLKHAQIGDDDKTRVSMEYDNARNCIRLTDPDYGTVTRQYDAYGQLMSSQIPRRVTTSYNYDELSSSERKSHEAEKQSLPTGLTAIRVHRKVCCKTSGIIMMNKSSITSMTVSIALQVLLRLWGITHIRPAIGMTTLQEGFPRRNTRPDAN